jgi:putative hydrolase of the HAD superfamily
MRRAFLIDLYDTLVHSEWDRWRDELSRGAGIPVETLDRAFHDTHAARNTGVYPTIEDSTRAIVLAAGLPDDPETIRWWVETDVRFMQESVQLHPDSLPTLRALRQRGDATVLVSNCGPDTRLLVDRFQLETEFDSVILSFEIGVRKPDAEIYEAALRSVGTRAEDALFVDDQVDYCDGARALGIDTRLMLRAGAQPNAFAASTDGHAVIHDLAMLLSWRDEDDGLRIRET